MRATNPEAGQAGLRRPVQRALDRALPGRATSGPRGDPRRALCPTTPGGLPVRLLVEGPPRRRPLGAVLVALAVVAAVAIPAFGRVYGRVRPEAAAGDRAVRIEGEAPPGPPADEDRTLAPRRTKERAPSRIPPRSTP